jgi:hypothetical protein
MAVTHGKGLFVSGAVAVLGVAIALFLLVARAKRDVREAVGFCNELIPRLEGARTKNGYYPQSIPESWLAGKSVPHLLEGRQFYDSYSNFFILSIRASKLLIDNAYDYNSTLGTWLDGDY